MPDKQHKLHLSVIRLSFFRQLIAAMHVYIKIEATLLCFESCSLVFALQMMIMIM